MVNLKDFDPLTYRKDPRNLELAGIYEQNRLFSETYAQNRRNQQHSSGFKSRYFNRVNNLEYATGSKDRSPPALLGQLHRSPDL